MVAGVGLVRDQSRAVGCAVVRDRGVDLHDRTVAAAIALQGAATGRRRRRWSTSTGRPGRSQERAAVLSRSASRQRPDRGPQPVGGNGLAAGGDAASRSRRPRAPGSRVASSRCAARSDVGFAGRDAEIQAPAHLPAERSGWPAEPARPPFDRAQLPGQEALALPEPTPSPATRPRAAPPAGRARRHWGAARRRPHAGSPHRRRRVRRGREPSGAGAGTGRRRRRRGDVRGRAANEVGRRHLRTVPGDGPRSAAITRSTSVKRYASEWVKCGHAASGYGIGRIE